MTDRQVAHVSITTLSTCTLVTGSAFVVEPVSPAQRVAGHIPRSRPSFLLSSVVRIHPEGSGQ